MPYFLKIEGIAGESTDAKHKGEIEVESFSWGVPSAEVVPGDEFSLACSKLQIEHKAQSPTGAAGAATVAGFDIACNQKL
jgi:type VI protein secretion system component Hcp